MSLWTGYLDSPNNLPCGSGGGNGGGGGGCPRRGPGRGGGGVGGGAVGAGWGYDDIRVTFGQSGPSCPGYGGGATSGICVPGSVGGLPQPGQNALYHPGSTDIFSDKYPVCVPL